MAALRITALLVVVLVLTAAVLAPARAQPTTSAIVVGTYVEPPFSMKSPRGEWYGIAIGLWREIARRENFSFRFEEYELENLLEAVERGQVDVAVGPVMITAHHERRFEMTSPFMHLGLAIATRPAEAGDWLAAVVGTASGAILKASLGLLVTMVFFGLVVWAIERRRNPDHFGGERVKGVGDAIWWSASTMTTVGYGDRTPITFWGRVVGILWMGISIVLVSAFIATVSSTLTLARLQTQIRSVHDLAHVRVGVVEGSGAEDFLGTLRISSVAYPDIEDALADLVARDIEAVVEESPVLRYLASTEYKARVSVVSQPFTRGFVAFALPLDSPRRRQIDVAMLEVLADPTWQELVRKFLGD